MISEAYVAGFFDGEGTVCAARRNIRYRPTPTILATISNTDMRPLRAIMDRWGGSIHTTKGRLEHHRDQHQLVLAPRNARIFLTAIEPHLIIKKQVARVAIEFCNLVMNTPRRDRVDYSHTVYRNGRNWVSPIMRPEFEAKIMALHAEIQRFNARTFSAKRGHLINANVSEPIPRSRVHDTSASRAYK